MSVKVDRVTKIYGSQRVLDDVSFQVEKGQITGLLGPNGAGKTT
ncbi:MAG TPA: ATP-binding cassette domain-containing protein, partial [Bacteroidales bacterium]|nr:ATP-binding cassette domain-containing protein [Bacteroidales bacterium]